MATQKLDLGRGLHAACTVTGSGPALLLLHGAEGSHRMFDALVPYLAPRFTVVAYDQRDCGETENANADSTLADLADDAKALLDALGRPKAHLYGTSFGGRVAQTFAHRHPQALDRLVLGSTWPLPHALDTLNEAGVRRIRALRAELPDSAEELAGLFFPEAFLNQRPELKGLFRTAQPASERSRRRFRTVDDRPALDPAAIVAPVLVVAGELDRVVPASVQIDLARAIAGAELVVLDGVGHAGALQAPERIAAEVVRFCLANERPSA